MVVSKFEWILNRVAEVETGAEQRPTSGSLKDDADDLVEELLTHASRSVDFPKLSIRLQERITLDLSTLRKAAAFFKSLNWSGSIVLTPELAVDPSQEVAALEKDVDRIESLLAADPTNTASLALDMRVGGQLLRLTMCAIKQGYPLEILIQLARQKIDLLAPEQVVLLWSLLQREFDPERDTRMETSPGILTDDFLKFDNDASAREKFAQYVVDLKPRLMLSLYGRNRGGYPIEVPSLPSVLTWRSSGAANPPSLQEIRLAKAIRRIVWISTTLFGRTEEELASVLRLDRKSPVIKAPDTPAANDTATIAAVCYELRKAAQLLSELSHVEADFPVCLRRYKLGLEVMTPHLNLEYSGKSEIFLQRELARFALERGFFVVGTQFGYGQTDLVSWETEALYVVETKLFKGDSPVRPAAITNAFAQLRSYMDKHPTTPRGLLLLYNLTPTHISAPEHWLRNRFLVIPINMQPLSPSHRTHTLEIYEGNDEQTILVLETGLKTQPRKPKSKRKAAKGGRSKSTR
jgi:hypothetical protein